MDFEECEFIVVVCRFAPGSNSKPATQPDQIHARLYRWYYEQHKSHLRRPTHARSVVRVSSGFIGGPTVYCQCDYHSKMKLARNLLGTTRKVTTTISQWSGYSIRPS